MGKTNLLDAIYFICMTKSNFINQDKNLINSSGDFFRVEAKISKEEDFKVVSKYDSSKKKVFELNDKPYDRLSDHVGKFPVVFVVPGDQALITEGSKERRKLLDNTLSQLDKEYLSNLYQYNSLLNQRNAYLKVAGKTPSFNEVLALTYSEKMEASAKYIHDKRKSFVQDFATIFSSKYALISNDQEKATCEYVSQLIAAEFIALTKENLMKDRYLGRTSVGVHKDDLKFLMNGRSVKYFASQGQTKSFILSIKLSQYEIISDFSALQPILLLDDLFDKLDHKRVQQLIELIEREKVNQVFISDTDENRVTNILDQMNVPYNKIVIENGKQISDEKAS